MKIRHLILCFFFFSGFLQNLAAQNNSDTANQPENQELSPFEIQERVYFTALNYNDYDAAKQALYEMIAIEPQYISLYDSLAYIYYQQGAYENCYLVSRDILQGDTEKTDILELKAISAQQLGMPKEALNDYEALYESSQSLYHLYEMASLQYQLERIGECENSLNTIINDGASGEQQITLSIDRYTQQTVPLKAAALNMKGIMTMDLKENDAAKEYFNKALEIAPEFQLPQNNLEAMQSDEEELKKGSTD